MQRTRWDLLHRHDEQGGGAPPPRSASERARPRPRPREPATLTPAELHALRRSERLTAAQSHAAGTRPGQP